MKKVFFVVYLSLLVQNVLYAQEEEEVGDSGKPLKIMHAEPLYIDLIRDLGAHKGENEWNVGLGLTDNLDFDSYEMLVEYEFAVVDRLGLEIEIPAVFHSGRTDDAEKPANRIESIKTAVQYTFLVNEKARLSAALGYINEFELTDLNSIGRRGSLFTGNVFNPFVIVAKRLGANFHSLIYTGPSFTYHFDGNYWSSGYEMHTNFHYMIPVSRNFIGLEINKRFDHNQFSMVLRPQMRLSIADNLLIGIVPGIPIFKREERLSSFMRLIYEPKHQHIRKRHKPDQ